MTTGQTLWFFMAVTRLLRLAERLTRPTAISLARISALAALADQGPTDVEGLAGHELVSGPTMVETVKALIASGWIDKSVNTEDRRRVRLRITPAGKRQLHAEEQRLSSLLATLTPGDRKTLERAAGILSDLTRRYSPEGPR